MPRQVELERGGGDFGGSAVVRRLERSHGHVRKCLAQLVKEGRAVGVSSVSGDKDGNRLIVGTFGRGAGPHLVNRQTRRVGEGGEGVDAVVHLVGRLQAQG